MYHYKTLILTTPHKIKELKRRRSHFQASQLRMCRSKSTRVLVGIKICGALGVTVAREPAYRITAPSSSLRRYAQYHRPKKQKKNRVLSSAFLLAALPDPELRGSHQPRSLRRPRSASWRSALASAKWRSGGVVRACQDMNAQLRWREDLEVTHDLSYSS